VDEPYSVLAVETFFVSFRLRAVYQEVMINVRCARTISVNGLTVVYFDSISLCLFVADWFYEPIRQDL